MIVQGGSPVDLDGPENLLFEKIIGKIAKNWLPVQGFNVGYANMELRDWESIINMSIQPLEGLSKVEVPLPWTGPKTSV